MLALYNSYKDGTVFINDQNRRLRRGDSWIFGPYWTHRFNDSFNTDLYYLYTEIDDDFENTDERNHPSDENAELHIAGIRVFGAPHPQIDYSVEFAQQFGDWMPGQNAEADFEGRMVDARLDLKAAEGTPLKPVLQLEYTYLSGDDPGTANEYEGWHPAYAEYPIWREELLPILFNGNWTNLNQVRTALGTQLLGQTRCTKAVNLLLAWSYLWADEGDFGGFAGGAPAASSGGGDEIGHLYSAFLDILVNDSLSFALEAAEFRPGNHWGAGESSEWLRFQTVFRF